MPRRRAYLRCGQETAVVPLRGQEICKIQGLEREACGMQFALKQQQRSDWIGG